MKKLVLTCTVLFALVGFTAPDAEAQFCFKFTAFCDGIQVDDITNNQITSQWYHFDCANNTPMTSGSKGESPISNACPGGNGAGLVNCVNCGGFGDWHFVIDGPLDGTFDMVSGQYPGGSCWIDQLAYDMFLGPCVGVKARGERSQAQNRSSVE